MNRKGQDRRIFEELMKFLDKKETSSRFSGQLVLEIGKFFLGAPYAAGTLDTKGGEHLVVNLREYDCVTFVENVVALAWCMESHRQRRHSSPRSVWGDIPAKGSRAYPVAGIKSQGKSFETFRRLLRNIRYRQGRLQGYSSRLHYFSDWIHDNRRKGIVRDVTEEIGGRPLRKAVTFMTTNPDFYPPLKNGGNLRKMKSVERAISKRVTFFIPKKAVRRLEGRIRDGDLIAITANTECLDVQHVGLAARVKNRVHLLHASSSEGKIVLSEKTLYRYLMESNLRSGIIVTRLTVTQSA